MSLPTFGVRSQQTGEVAANKEDFFNAKNNIPAALAKEIAQYEAAPRHTTTGNETKELVHKVREDNNAARKAFRWPKQEELRSKRVGKILHMNSFLLKLKLAGVKAWYTNKGGSPGTLGLFVDHTGMRPTCKHKDGEPHYVGAAQVPYMQEYEELHFDEFDVPLGPKRRGWRTLLLYLFEQGLLTPAQADKAFGAPASGPVSRRYREYVKYLKGRGLGL